MTGGSDTDSQIPCDIGQDAHHHELGDSQPQRAERQSDQTLFHFKFQISDFKFMILGVKSINYYDYINLKA